MLMGHVGLRPEKGCAGNAQQKLKTTDPTTHQRERPTSINHNYLNIIKETKIGHRTDWPADLSASGVTGQSSS
jgi:hypothetical protein